MKIELRINQEQRNYAKQLGASIMNFREGTPGYNCKDAKQEHYLGFIGEVVLADYLEQERPKLGEALAYDHIINGLKINLKVSSYYGPNTYLKVRKGYNKIGFDGYILGHIPRTLDRLFLLGYISKKNFDAKKELRNFGYYETETVELGQMDPLRLIGLPIDPQKKLSLFF